MTKRKLGLIGAGKIGGPMCRNLIKAGYEVCVYDIDQSKLQSLVGAGARPANSLLQAAANSDVIFSSLPNDKTLLKLTNPIDGLLAALSQDKIWIETSTVSPATSAKINDALKPIGTAYLRATVSGSIENAKSGTLSFYVSGPEPAFKSCENLFEVVGSKIIYCGEGEEARVLKLLINMIVITFPALLGEALNFGKKSGLDWKDMIEAIEQSVIASPLLQYKAERLKARDWTAMAPISLTQKDLGIALEWGQKNNVPMLFTSLMQQLNSAFMASDEGEKDFFYAVTWPDRLSKDIDKD